MTGKLRDELTPRQERIEAALRSALQRVTADAPRPVADAMAYSLFAPGKRLRPLLVMLACEATGGTAEQSLPAACAIEMVHTYSLVHDDLPAMDDDDLRRGLPTCHKKFGEALAILAGDALLTAAFEVLANGCPPRTATVSCLELARGAGAVGMVGGQTLDLMAEGKIAASGRREPAVPEDANSADVNSADVNSVAANSRLTPAARLVPEDANIAAANSRLTPAARLENIHARKTGALFRSALRLGVYAAQAERSAGVNPETLTAADQYAAAFGLLFQVTDDLLDVESTAEAAGKRVGKDAARGKLTYPGLLGIEESRRKAAELGHHAVAAAEQLGSPLLALLARYVVTRER